MPAILTNDELEGMMLVRRLLSEPLLHFLLIGIALFALYDVLRGGDPDAPRDIVISQARVDALAESFATAWLRPPTPEEMRGLVDDYITEEIYYREAIAMGLDRDDTIVRRRLRQKMEFISEDAAAALEPTDAELQAYLVANPGKFLEPAALTYMQVYFSTEKRGDQARLSAEKLLAALQAGGGPPIPGEAGDPSLLPGDMQSASPELIANTFGQEFAAQIAAAPVSQWTGPLESGFGWHVVRVDDRQAGAMPALDQVRPIVLREWQSEQRTRSNDKYRDDLRAKYDIRVEGDAAALFAQPAAGGRAPTR